MIKQRVLEGFEEGFKDAVNKVAQRNPNEWENNPPLCKCNDISCT